MLATLLRFSLSARRKAGLLGLGMMFIFTGVGHFIVTQEMSRMLPPQIPGRVWLVYITGLLEIAAAAALVVGRWRPMAGWLMLVMLVGFLPANIYAAIQRIPLGGHEWGPVYLLMRVPLQFFIIAWVVYFALRPNDRTPN